MQREMSELIIKRRIKDERIGFVSVTRVDLLADLSEAFVYVSLFGTEEENPVTLKALIQNVKFFQSSMGRNLRLRQTPKLTIKEDHSIQEGDHILNVIENSGNPS